MKSRMMRGKVEAVLRSIANSESLQTTTKFGDAGGHGQLCRKRYIE